MSASGAGELRRLLMVTPHYLPEIGGVEHHVHEVAPRLAAAGVAVTVLTTNPDGAHPERELLEGIEVRRVAVHQRRGDWGFAPEIAPVVAGGGWDLVHVQSYHTFVAPLAMAAAARARIPYLLTFHGGGHSDALRNRLRRVQRGALRPLLARASALVAVASFEIDAYARELRLPRGRFVLIPNGVDLPPVPEGPADDGGDHPLIASVGRLERYKGHQRVIAALPHLLAAEPGARLWIAGTGPYEAELRAHARRLGVERSVTIEAVPAGERAEMARRLAAADLVVLLSDFETQPIAALEAIALGRPLLVASGSGLGELADRGLARAVEASSPPGRIATAMLRELREPLARPPVALPSWEDCAAALLSLHRSIVARRACAS